MAEVNHRHWLAAGQGPRLKREWLAMTAVLGAVAAIAAIIGGTLDPQQFFRSYLFAFIFWLGLPLGSMVFALMLPLVGGAWSVMLRPVLIQCVWCLPVLALLFIPLAFGLSSLYPWALPEALQGAVAYRSPYLNPGFFLLRAALYFAVWGVLVWLLIRADRPVSASPAKIRPTWAKASSDGGQRLGAAGLIALVVTTSLAGIDWLMSLEATYYSTIYGLLFLVGPCLQALAACIAAAAYYRPVVPDDSKVFRDLGSLLATCVLLWAYLQYSQLIVNWSGNQVVEIPWYLHRLKGGWEGVAAALLVLNFAAPFFILLFRRVKDQRQTLAVVALTLVAVHILDVYWLVVPSFGVSPRVHWLDVAIWLGMGAICLATLAVLNRRRIISPSPLQQEVAR